MTKRDFELIAKILARNKPVAMNNKVFIRDTPADVVLWRNLTAEFESALAGTNARFDGERFVAACHGA